MKKSFIIDFVRTEDCFSLGYEDNFTGELGGVVNRSFDTLLYLSFDDGCRLTDIVLFRSR